MKVKATVEFEIPARDNEPDSDQSLKYSGSIEENWSMWLRPTIDKTKRFIIDCLEDEHHGICDFDTVVVSSVSFE